MSSSSTSKQPAIYKRWTNLWRESQNPKKLPSNCTQTACSFFQTCKVFLFIWGFWFFCFALFFCFLVLGKAMVKGGNGDVPQVPPSVGIALKQQNSESRCAGRKASTVAFQASLPWWPEAGAWGLLSPDSMRQEAWGLELSCVPTSPPEQWRPGLRGLLWPGGPWGPCPWHTLALPWRPFKQMPCKALCLTHDLYVKP